jgi:hypothetical protein
VRHVRADSMIASSTSFTKIRKVATA